MKSPHYKNIVRELTQVTPAGTTRARDWSRVAIGGSAVVAQDLNSNHDVTGEGPPASR